MQRWFEIGPVIGKRENVLRAKAAIDRCIRLTSDYSDAVMDIYAGPAATLGSALGVPAHMAQIFAGIWLFWLIINTINPISMIKPW